MLHRGVCRASGRQSWSALLARRGPFFGLLLALLALLLQPTARAAGVLRVDFIDVGQGDSALVTSPTGKTVLIDGGPRRSSRALTTFLAGHTKGPIDLILLTHRHEDHLGGLSAVVRTIGARLFLDAPVPHSGPAYAELVQVLAANGVDARLATRGRKIDLGGGATITLVGPPEPAIVGSRSDVNANSVVARLDYGTFSALFAGDAEAATETWLLSSGAEIHATVLKVAHHGSRYASSPRFLRAVGARIAVVSAGTGNDYGHPAPETLARVAHSGTSVYRTDMDGDVAIETNGLTVHIHASSGREEKQAIR